MAESLEAVIQFRVTGEEPGDYYLRIAGGKCEFQKGIHGDPTLMIRTPSEVWMKVTDGELSGEEAMAEGLYEAEGDLSLLVDFERIFKVEQGADATKAEPGKRMPGPLKLPPGAWMFIAFIPWIVFWFTFGFDGISHWVSVGIPLVAATAVIAYRLRYGAGTPMEYCAFFFFAFAFAAVLAGFTAFEKWGVEISQAVLATTWLVTLFLDMPLTGNYIKWGFREALTRTTLFKQPNAVLTLMWGWIYIATAVLGIGSIEYVSVEWPITIVRYGLLIPGFIITSRYPRKADSRSFIWEKSIRKIRIGATAGIIATAVILILLLTNML